MFSFLLSVDTILPLCSAFTQILCIFAAYICTNLRSKILAFLITFVALCLASNGGPFRDVPQAAKPLQDTIRAGKGVAKAVRSAAKAVKDSTQTRKDSAIVAKDSAKSAAMAANGAAPLSIDTLNIDSLHKDSTKRGAPFEAPVDFKAADSLVYYAANKQVLLYGKGQVKYQNMTLDAGRIAMNMDSSLVFAEGVRDSDSVLVEKPVYRQGSDTYTSERMAYNFKTQKGFITNVNTTQGNGYIQSESSKRTADGTLYLEHAKYTTCDAPHPHFYLKLSRAKVIPNKETVFGPAYLVVADVPLPLGVPYGFFPFNKKYSSGLVMPKYGDETRRGFYLRDGGYYFALSDYMDLKVLGEIYTKGSWGLSAETNYKKRYKYNGNFYVSFLRTVEGDKNLPDYSVTKSLKVQWMHQKTAVEGTNGFSFSARVNFASENYERSNLESMYNPSAYTQSTRASSISFSKTFSNIGLTLSGSTNLSQNMRDSTIAMTLPDLTFSLNRFYPFRRKRQVGQERWYEKISMSYTGQFSNSITTKENRLLKSSLIKDWRNGMQHNIPIEATFQLFKYINISPNFTFRDLMYTNRITKSWDAVRQVELSDTTRGFYNLYDWNVGVSANTTLYGFYKPLPFLFGKKVVMFRHVFKPSVSFSYAPDFTAPHYGYVKSYDRIDASGNVERVPYSPYEAGIFGYPSSTKQGTVTFNMSNNLEMKVRSDKDSTGVKKISLIDELGASLSYNLAAKERPWSDLSTRIRLKLTKSYTLSLAAVFATYAYVFNSQGQVVTGNRTEWSYGRFGRFQGMSQNLSYTFDNNTWKKLKSLFRKGGSNDFASGNDKREEENSDNPTDANIDPTLRDLDKKGQKVKQKAKVDRDGYMAFSLPWSLTISYGVTMYENRNRPINTRRMRYPYGFTQTLNASGFVRIADGWNISFSTGYDFNFHQLSMTTASVSRDLHCFEMSCSVVLRPYSSFNFTFRAKANELADALKWDKRSSYSTNVEWY